ncbi:nucleotidyltransferase family protein [Candidatus Woesearchaeota archaeon]|nr:nucleotidyltransferase family protein [Candidatus Woesearchaeota archaeon]
MQLCVKNVDQKLFREFKAEVVRGGLTLGEGINKAIENYAESKKNSIILTKEQIMERIEKHKEKIKSFGVKKLTLFGSYASGNATSSSDIDFLVEFETGRGLFHDYVELLHLLEDLFGKKIDLVKPHLIREELKESILGGKKIVAKL